MNRRFCRTLTATAMVVLGSLAAAAPAGAQPLSAGSVTFAKQCTADRADNVILGTDGDDVLQGTPGDDVICGFGGDDVIVGGNGDDILVGGPGEDLLVGGGGNDQLSGDGDDDRLLDTRGAGSAVGGSGTDLCIVTQFNSYQSCERVVAS